MFFRCISAMIVLASGNLFADAVLEDFEAKNQNKFGYYWFYFDDSNDGGNSTLPGLTKDGDYAVTPTTGGHAGNCLMLPYKLGPKATTNKCNYVGCGTMLCADKDSLNITGATGFSFWAKAKKETYVDFMVLTKSVKDYAYHHKVVTVPTEWTQITVALADLEQPTWGKKVTFDPKCATKLQWQMHTDNVGKDSSGTVYLDDIVIAGYTFVAANECPTCAGAPGSGTGAILSDMDASPNDRNARRYFWYCYNDAENHATPVASQSDFSRILAGAAIDIEDLTAAPSLTIDPEAKKGYNNTPGAYLNFTLGPSFKQAGDTTAIIRPDVGLGTLLSKNGTATDVYDAKADGATGIYFDYMLASSSPTTQLTLEVYANSFTKGGVVHHVKLPATCGSGEAVWKGATVPFTKLKLPAWQGVDQTVALDATIMKKLQWVVQDAPGVQCELSIDNVYFLGATKITVAAKVRGDAAADRSVISARVMKKTLRVSLPSGFKNASLALVDTRGAIRARASRCSGKSALLDIKGLAKGLYVLVVKERAYSGTSSRAIPVTVH
jgi:hypothetical protein